MELHGRSLSAIPPTAGFRRDDRDGALRLGIGSELRSASIKALQAARNGLGILFLGPAFSGPTPAAWMTATPPGERWESIAASWAALSHSPGCSKTF